MMRFCARKASSRWPPSSNLHPAARSFAAASDSERPSVAVTMAPRAAQKSAVAMPVRASPTTNTRLPSSSIPGFTHSLLTTQELQLPQLQRGQRKQCKNQCGNPEAHDYFGLAPTRQLKMMVNRRHPKNAAARYAIRRHLKNHGERFNHENSAHKKQQYFLLDDDGDHAKCPAQRQ